MFHTIFLLYIATLVAGDFTPIAPGPGDSFAAGGSCTIKWEVGGWKNVTITLMSGSNSDMKPVTSVASGLDGSDPSFSPFIWTCPEVFPYSPIYFYQFTNGNDTQNSRWTTRFLITSPSGASVVPDHSSQPNSDLIPWGIGTLSTSNSNSPSTVTSSSNSSTATVNSNDDTSSDSLAPYKASKTVLPETRQANPTLALPPDSAGISGGPPVGYSSSKFNAGARSVTKGSNWSPSLSVVLVVSAISWLV
ncbi:hypothetical protein L218DRAFT_1073386 [Marasmius fiardii PR-910]|nr:hypothetical protein L218DRAFT_1073386 [Marasmius fiardii PR-910]